MDNSFIVKKLLHTTEEKQPVSYKPFIAGNQCFIVAQQNVRRIEEIACFSFGILNPNGEITVLDPTQYAALLSLFLNQNKTCELAASMQQNNSNVICGVTVPNFILPVLPQISNSSQANQTTFPPFRFHCTRSTSTTELTSQSVENQQIQSSNKKYYFIDLTKNEPADIFGSSSTDRCEYCGKLNAREQLKQKKIDRDNGF